MPCLPLLFAKVPLDTIFQHGQDLFCKPRVFGQPNIIPRAGMGKGYYVRCIVLPMPDRFGQAVFASPAEMPCNRKLSDSKSQFDFGQRSQEFFTPGCSTSFARRQVPRRPCTGVAESHRYDGKHGRIVKYAAVYAKPFPQAVAARIIEWNAAFMHPNSGCLTGDQYAGLRRSHEHGAGCKRQFGGAKLALLDILVQKFESGIDRFGVQFRDRASLTESAVNNNNQMRLQAGIERPKNVHDTSAHSPEPVSTFSSIW